MVKEFSKYWIALSTVWGIFALAVIGFGCIAAGLRICWTARATLFGFQSVLWGHVSIASEQYMASAVIAAAVGSCFAAGSLALIGSTISSAIVALSMAVESSLSSLACGSTTPSSD